MSGPDAIHAASRIFKPKSGDVSAVPSQAIRYGWLVRGDEEIDEGLILIMRAPRSYTGEDVVEINCHGGPLVLREGVELAVAAGARIAEPGEFTKRAFLNGRIDLAQAEAVADIINARTRAGLKAATRQLDGELSEVTGRLRSELVEVAAELEAAVDFSDEDIETTPYPLLRRRTVEVGREIESLLAGSAAGRIVREGVSVVVAGRPNVGKSSLFNMLIHSDRAIVTGEPGTTRDVIEESIVVDGVLLRLCDTAGICEPKGEPERQGVERSRSSAASADVVLLVVDGSEDLQSEDEEAAAQVKGQRALVAVNKSDLPRTIKARQTTRIARAVGRGAQPPLFVSAKTGEGLDRLRAEIVRRALDGLDGGDVPLTNIRHEIALRQALEAVRRASEQLKGEAPEEIVSTDVREALDALGELTGETTNEDILSGVFSRFCIGK